MKKSVIGITLLSALAIAPLSFGETYQQRARYDDRRVDTPRQHVQPHDRRRSESPLIVKIIRGTSPPVERWRTGYGRPFADHRFTRRRHFRRWSPPPGRPFERQRYAPRSWWHRHAPRPWWRW